MRCAWCHNPETIEWGKELGLVADRCNGCGACTNACPHGALEYDPEKGIQLDLERCVHCGICVEECNRKVFYLVGEDLLAEDLVRRVLADKLYFDHSNGGITVSGGEPFLQAAFTQELLRIFRGADVHTIVQTNLSLDYDTHIAKSLSFTDHLMVDLKLLDPSEHQNWTGINNARILENITRLDLSGNSYEIRTPVVPGVNDSEESVSAITQFLKTLKNLKNYTLIPYHPLGLNKYEQLGKQPSFNHTAFFDSEMLKILKANYEPDTD